MLIARQPIFEKNRTVFAYQLLYREEGQNQYACEDDSLATSRVISGSFLSYEYQNLVGDKKAFINFTPALLSHDIATLFPKELLVIDITDPGTDAGQSVYDACLRLNALGYTLSFNDQIFQPGFEAFIPLADIVKIDFQKTPTATIGQWIRRFKQSKLHFLAAKVESETDYQAAVQLGFSYFQGYFFSKPVVIPSNNLAPNKLNALRLINMLNQPEVDFESLTQTIERDVAFSYEILKIVNSAFYFRGNEIRSVREALVRLGMYEVKKWGMISALRRSGDGQSAEVINYSMVRSKFMEMMAELIGQGQMRAEYLTVGILSMIDVLMHADMDSILKELNLSPSVRDALLQQDTQSSLSLVHQLVLHCEQGNWDLVAALAGHFNMSVSKVAAVHHEAIKWALELNRSLGRRSG